MTDTPVPDGRIARSGIVALVGLRLRQDAKPADSEETGWQEELQRVRRDWDWQGHMPAADLELAVDRLHKRVCGLPEPARSQALDRYASGADAL